MRDLAVRLAALDSDASAALKVIAYFDGLVEAQAGLQSIVRGAAVLAGCPARLVDDTRRVRIRVLPDGAAAAIPSPPIPSAAPNPSAPNPSAPSPSAPNPSAPNPSAPNLSAPGHAAPGRDVPDAGWPCIPVGSGTLWLERPGPAGPVDAMVLERASGAARSVLDRTRGRAPAADPASVELVIDASAPDDVRRQAARRLGLALDAPAVAIARPGGVARVQPATTAPPEGRCGIGPAVPVLELPRSYADARTALRFAAEGTDEDPGDTAVHHTDLGTLAVLAGAPTDVPDVRALEHAAAAAPWTLTTLHAAAWSPSLRAAATTLRLHHSTLQDRITHAEQLLGWNVRDPHGRLRLQLALTLRRLARHP